MSSSAGAVRYSPAIEKALAEVCPSEDPIDQPDFDPIEYLNQQLPDESRLGALPTMLAEHQHRLSVTETELLDAVKIQATTAHSAARDLHSAREAVVGLHQRVSGIKTKAEESERTVTEICRSIRQLDAAKRNLGESIKTLRNLQLLMIQLQKLRQGFQARDYPKINDALRGAQARSKEFEEYKDIPKVNELQTKLHYLTQEIEGHIHSAFVLMLNKYRDQQNEENPQSPGDGGVSEDELSSCCSIIDAIGDKSMASLRKKIIQSELDAYTTMFRRGSEDARLERTEQRYAFIRRLLDTNEHLFSTVIPKHWCLPQELAVDFCLKTYEELTHQLRVEAGSMEVAVLVYVLQRTLDIEKELTFKLAWMDDQERKELASYKYYGMIVPCFHDHMGLYVNKEDETMDEAVGKGVDPDDWQDDNKNSRVNAWLSSADDLFVFIRESLKRVAKLGQPTTMGQMAVVYRKHLVAYSQLLSTHMPSAPMTPEQERRVCMVINTGEFCYDTSEKLADEVRNKLRNEVETDLELAEMVNFDDVLEAYAGLKSSGILALVVGLDRKINQPMTEFSTGNFLNRLAASGGEGLDGGESPYVVKITNAAKDHVSNCALLLPPRDLKFFLEKFASNFAPRYCSVLYKLQRRLNDMAVNQLRVDLKLVESTFTKLPFAGSDLVSTVTQAEPRFEPRELTRYLKIIRGQFQHMAHSLKVLQCETDLNLVDMYMQLVDKEQQSQTDFCMLVEVKGVKREDMRPWITALQRADVPETTNYDEARKPKTGAFGGGAAAGGGSSSSANTFNSPTSNAPRATSAGGGGGGDEPVSEAEDTIAKFKSRGTALFDRLKTKAAEARGRTNN